MSKINLFVRSENLTPPIFFNSLACLYTQALHDVNTSHQNVDNSIKSYGELIVSTATYNKTDFTHILVHKHHKNPQKNFPKIQNNTRTLLHKPAFMPKYFSNKSAKTLFGGDFLIIWLSGSFFMLRCSKTSLVEKTGYAENGETKLLFTKLLFYKQPAYKRLAKGHGIF